ncbi:hypothetical protein DIPPA_31727 [Diplonema papillatum]|nr:hypothetical protein DIPPA_31727 [Diplonema papillatum]
MSWFTDAMAQVKKSAEVFTEKAAELTDQVKKNAIDVSGKIREQVESQESLSSLKKHFELDPQYSQQNRNKAEAADSAAAWCHVPESWTERGKEWEVLAKGVLLDDNTFLVGPCNRVAPSHINFERDAVTPEYELACIAFKPLAEARFQLVPKWVSDQNFWANYQWKLRELARSTTIRELEATLRSLNKDPIIPPLAVGKRVKNRGITHENDVIAEIVARVEEERKTTQRLKDYAQQVGDEVSSATDNASLLKRVVARANGKSSDLIDSVFESCQYHKQKLTALLEQGEAEPASYHSALPLGSIRKSLEYLKQCMDFYESNGDTAVPDASPPPSKPGSKKEDVPASHPPPAVPSTGAPSAATAASSGKPAPASPATPPSDSPADCTPSASAKPDAPPTATPTRADRSEGDVSLPGSPASSSVVVVDKKSPTAAKEDYFGGTMPWEEDED